MTDQPRFLRSAAAASALIFATLIASPVCAQVNDDWTNATVITALPYSDTVTTSTATIEPTDPQSICFVGANSSVGKGSVWYRYTTGASSEYLNLSTQGSSYDTVVQVFTGVAGAFDQVLGGCNDDGVP
ncbi:MAG: hypothetical protein ABIR16_01630, partial [Dokdonella sp.]